MELYPDSLRADAPETRELVLNSPAAEAGTIERLDAWADFTDQRRATAGRDEGRTARKLPTSPAMCRY